MRSLVIPTIEGIIVRPSGESSSFRVPLGLAAESARFLTPPAQEAR